MLTPSALPLAGAAAAVTGLVALLLIGRLAAAGARGLTDARPVTHRGHWWGRVPWELSLLAAAPVAWWLLADDQVADEAAAGGTPTVVASRRIVPGPDTLTVGGEEIPVRVAATRPLPGAQSAYPLVLVHRDALAAAVSQPVLDRFWPQIWIAGDPDRTRAEIAAAQLAPDRVVTVDDQRGGALYEPVTYTFQYLIALSVFTGLIGAVGLLLYLESRTTTHRRAYVMLRRLGLRPGAHRRALLLELGTPVTVGLATGLGVAVGIAYPLRSGFDLDPGRFPDTLLTLPATMAAIVAAAAVTIATCASLLTHARISRANPGEVLRDTT